MSAASRERQRQKHLSHLRRGFATWEEFRNWQDKHRAIWLLENANYSSSLRGEDKREYTPYEDLLLKSPPSEWEDVIEIHQCLKISEN